MKCNVCGGKMAEMGGAHSGIPYSAFKCIKCGEELMNTQQAKGYMNAAEKAKIVTFSKWGEAIAIRIPAYLVKKFGISGSRKGKLTEEKDGFRITPMPT